MNGAAKVEVRQELTSLYGLADAVARTVERAVRPLLQADAGAVSNALYLIKQDALLKFNTVPS